MHLTRYQAIIICAALLPASVGPSVGQPADDRFGASAAPSIEAPREQRSNAVRTPAKKQKASPPKTRATGEPKQHKKAQPKAPAVVPPKPTVQPKATVQPKPAEKPSIPVPAARPAVVAPSPAQPVAPPPVQPAQTPPPAKATQTPQPAHPAQTPPVSQAAVSDEKLAVCFACHGAAGRSETPQMPSLAAQPAPFILAQLKMMVDGKRKIDAMQAVMPEFSEANIRIYAEKISKLPKPPAPPAPSDTARYERGQKLAAASRCANCHNNAFTGAGTNPSLARQRDDYLVKALRDYKSGARVDAGGIMVASVKDLKDTDFADLAYYLANLR
jgi:cytochrome c553